MEQLKTYFKGFELKNILDVGTGTGDFVKVLQEVFPFSKITGIDPNPESLNQAKQKYSGVSFLEMTGEKLDFTDGSFDLASISMALHHLPNVYRTLKEMQRVVKPGGWIIVNELFSDNLNPAQEVHKMYHHFRSKIDRLIGVTHNETFEKEEILHFIKNSGIEILFHFEFNKAGNLITGPKDIEERVEKMRKMLEPVKDFPEFKELEPGIEEFRTSVTQFGFQPATKVVVLGRAK